MIANNNLKGMIMRVVFLCAIRPVCLSLWQQVVNLESQGLLLARVCEAAFFAKPAAPPTILWRLAESQKMAGLLLMAVQLAGQPLQRH